ncbi:hypothetical protein DC31_14880 [Microbacterium sp. CH12i]|nr:hypothetical protein DC31_14880 [Microbacterium sp. CH12i]
MVASPRCGTVSVLAGDSETVGGSVSGWAAADGPQLEAAEVTEPAATQDRAAHRRVAAHAPVGPAPDRVSPGVASLDGRACAGPIWHAEADSRRSGHRAAGA